LNENISCSAIVLNLLINRGLCNNLEFLKTKKSHINNYLFVKKVHLFCQMEKIFFIAV
jgi:hypothetical protein